MAPDLLTRRRLPLAAVPAAALVAAQIAYPLAGGTARDRLTIAIVLLFATACVVHAATSRGLWTAALMLLATAGLGFAAEVLGVHTGVPFGGYSYATTLGPRLAGVPLVVAFAWTMLAWPAAIVARKLVAGTAARVLVGAWGLTAADLFLDPQLVADGHWRWHDPDPHLPGVADVPLTNYAGWFAVALVLSCVLQALLRGSAGDADAVPVALYLWLYVGWIVADVAFLDLRASAAWGALGMGVVVVPLAVVLVRPAPLDR